MMNRRSLLKGLMVLPFFSCSSPPRVSKGMSLDQLESLARENLKSYKNCAQATFATLDACYSLQGARVFKALTPFPGMGMRGETCGGVSGALAAMGLLFGKDKNGSMDQMKIACATSREFCKRFKKEMGSSKCQKILKSHTGFDIDLSRPEGRKLYEKANGGKVCRRCVSTGVRIAVELIRECPHGLKPA